jgi:carbamate kinase
MQAACQFVSNGGRMAAIGSLADATAILDGLAGTRIVNGAWGDRPDRD